MATGRACTAVVIGVTAHPVQIEAHVAPGLPHWTMVGLPDTAVSESRDRVRAAVASSALPWPTGRITVGLSPASLPKRGSGLDLGIAVAVMTAHAAGVREDARDWIFIGELGLDGTVRAVGSVLPVALAAADGSPARLVVPAASAAEAQLVPGLDVLPVVSLAHLWAELTGDAAAAAGFEVPVVRADPGHGTSADDDRVPDLSDVRGQPEAREALIVAAAGGHHVCFAGAAGVGKTMLASRLPSLLPDLDDADALTATAIRALTSPDTAPGLVRRPPVVAPHHTTTSIALIGGGSVDRPRIGLVTKAHAGVLFLDEAAEFSAVSLDALRQSLETGRVTVARSGFHVELPARFQLVLTTNPCPCGRALDTGGRPCSCTPAQRRRYLARLAGPLLDRVDVRVTLRRPTLAELAAPAGDTSAAAAALVQEARGRAATRWRGTGWRLNADVPAAALRRVGYVPEPTMRVLDAAGRSTDSVRGLDLSVRVAWTLADVRGHDAPTPDDMADALALRASEVWLT